MNKSDGLLKSLRSLLTSLFFIAVLLVALPFIPAGDHNGYALTIAAFAIGLTVSNHYRALDRIKKLEDEISEMKLDLVKEPVTVNTMEQARANFMSKYGNKEG